jgi:hypothetical protein
MEGGVGYLENAHPFLARHFEVSKGYGLDSGSQML